MRWSPPPSGAAAEDACHLRKLGLSGRAAAPSEQKPSGEKCPANSCGSLNVPGPIQGTSKATGRKAVWNGSQPSLCRAINNAAFGTFQHTPSCHCSVQLIKARCSPQKLRRWRRHHHCQLGHAQQSHTTPPATAQMGSQSHRAPRPSCWGWKSGSLSPKQGAAAESLAESRRGPRSPRSSAEVGLLRGSSYGR